MAEKPVQITRGRVENLRPWKKGESGNPGGRPKALAELRAMCRDHTHEAIAAILAIAQTAEEDAVRLAAWRELLDRGYGKPTQPLSNGDEHEIENMTPEERTKRAVEDAREVLRLAGIGEANADDS